MQSKPKGRKAMKKQVKITAIAGGSVAAGIALIATAVAVWNSRQLKMLRAYKKTGMILGRVGIILQSVADAME